MEVYFCYMWTLVTHQPFLNKLILQLILSVRITGNQIFIVLSINFIFYILYCILYILYFLHIIFYIHKFWLFICEPVNQWKSLNQNKCITICNKYPRWWTLEGTNIRMLNVRLNNFWELHLLKKVIEVISIFVWRHCAQVTSYI